MSNNSEKAVEPGPRIFAQWANSQSNFEANGAQIFVSLSGKEHWYCANPCLDWQKLCGCEPGIGAPAWPPKVWICIPARCAGRCRSEWLFRLGDGESAVIASMLSCSTLWGWRSGSHWEWTGFSSSSSSSSSESSSSSPSAVSTSFPLSKPGKSAEV